MYLQDFQKIGGIFVPGEILDATLKTVCMQGELHLGKNIFYIKIKAKKGSLVKIVQVCGRTIEEAEESKQKLKEIYITSFRENLFHLKDFVRARQVRFLKWLFLVLLDLFCMVFAAYCILMRGFSLFVLIVGICSLFLLLVSLIYRKPMVLKGI